MARYLLYRLLLMIPTLIGIMVVNFLIIQAAPGGPVQQILSKVRGSMSDVDTRLGGASDFSLDDQDSSYRGGQGIDPAFIKELEKQFGFDIPPFQRFIKMMKSYAQFDFGKSYFRDQKVIDIILSKLPVSVSLGLWTTLIVYLLGIPLGIRKAVKDGSFFDVMSSFVVIIAYAVPSFLFALFLMVFFAGGSFFSWFPIRGLYSENFETLSWLGKIKDYFWHITLPVMAMITNGFAKLTLLTKNSVLDEISKIYVLTARAKGASEKSILWGHVFRNAMLIVIAGFPAAFVAVFFTSSLLIEVLFSLDGLGLLGFEAAMNRDYPLMFGTLYMFTILGMVLHLIGDIAYTLVDPRIDLTTHKG
jgi:microcin C transport system permease protein